MYLFTPHKDIPPWKCISLKQKNVTFLICLQCRWVEGTSARPLQLELRRCSHRMCLAFASCLCFIWLWPSKVAKTVHFELLMNRKTHYFERKMCKIYFFCCSESLSIQTNPLYYRIKRWKEKKKQRSSCKYCRGVCFS